VAFNPDEFLATKAPSQGEFNPDAFLGKPSPAQPVAEQPQETEQPGMLDRIGEAFTGSKRMTPQMEQLQEIGGAPELNKMSVPAFKASLGLLSTGETGPLKAILSQQFGEDVTFEDDEKGNVIVNLPSGQYALNKPGLSGQDIVRGAFDMLAFTPAGRAASIPAAIGKSAATEAVIESAEAGVGGEFNVEDIALAGGIGGAGKSLESGISAATRMIKGSPVNEIVDAGKMSGIPVFTSDIKQPKTFVEKTIQQTGEKVPLAGTGALREKQQVLREEAVNKVAEKYGDFSYQSIINSLKEQKNKVKNAAGNVLNSTGKKLDDIGEIPLTNTSIAIKEVSDEMTKPGVIQSSGAIDDLNVLADSISSAPQTFTTLKENRTAFREIVKGADKAERTQLTSRSKALLKKVESSMKKDMDIFAKDNLTSQEYLKWNKANKVYAEEAYKLTKTKLKNVLDKGDVTPENVQSMLFSQKPSEVKSLYKSLTPSGRSNARSAIISKIVNNLGKRAAGITPNSFATELGKYGLQTDQFFKGEEKRALNGLLKVLNATRRAQDASIATPTGQQLLGVGAGVAAATNLPLTVGLGGTLGASARLYESAPIRSALLRLDSIPRGSTHFDRALTEVLQLLTAGAQTAREGVKE